MNLTELNRIATAMVVSGKGILAADESSGTIKKRFDAIGVDSTEDNRRDYREMLFRSSEAMNQYISGVILYDETIWQDAKDGTPLIRLIEQSGAIPGIKVDEGTQALPMCPGELVTVGLDKLAERLKKYYERGARFAKWRAVIDIGSGNPSMTAINVKAHALARYAALCQAAPQKAWSGKAENVAAGQTAFSHRARMNGLAAKGEWQSSLEKKAA